MCESMSTLIWLTCALNETSITSDITDKNVFREDNLDQKEQLLKRTYQSEWKMARFVNMVVTIRGE